MANEESKELQGKMRGSIKENLHAVVLRLLPKAPVTIPIGLGYQVHAAFLAMIGEVDSDLAEDLHTSGTQYRPFTASPLRGGKRIEGERLLLSPDRTCSLRFTVLTPHIYRRLAHHLLLPQRLPSLRLGEAELLITGMIGTPGSSTWADYATWEGLLEGAHLDPAITLEFASPTAFRQGDLDLPLPVPRLVFSGYLQKWNKYSGSPFDRELLDIIERHVGVKEHTIKTVPFKDGRVTIPGFVGKCTFLIKGKLEEEFIKQINCLADFAFFAGTGRKTTHGMGMTRRIR